MTGSRHFDAIVIGAGQGGVPFARASAQTGRSTALVERAEHGGTCINTGCTPTKTMIASAREAYVVGRAADYGVGNGLREGQAPSVDMARVRQRKRDVVRSFRESGEKRTGDAGVEIVWGEARFAGDRALDVRLRDGGEARLTADTIVIDTGTRPARPPLPGLDGVPALDSTSIMELDRVPEHLLVLGGGYVGVEFAQMFRRFGSRVTVAHRGPHLLSREDDDVADEVAKVLREDGVEVLLETKAARAARSGNGVALTVQGPDGERTLTGTHLLVATGRVPNTEALDPAAGGVKVDERGYIPVDRRLETNVRGVYAIGDVNGGPAFTHISYDDFRVLRDNLLEGRRRTTEGRLVPYTVFTDPQLGRVGLTESQARAAGGHVQVAKMPMGWVARAIEVGETRGFMKAVVDGDTQRILGAAVLGIEGGELMAMLEIAMLGDLPYTALVEAIFAHPTLAESLNNLFANLQ